MLAGKDVERGKRNHLRGSAAEGVDEIAERLEKALGARVRFDEEKNAATQGGRSEGNDEGFGGVGEAGEPLFDCAAAEGVERFLERRMATNAREKLSDRWEKHHGEPDGGRPALRMRSRMAVVE